jgi:hypothetical protein
MRTANRNIDYLRKVLEQINNDTEVVQKAINRLGTPKQIDAFFDKFTIAFGKWLIQRNQRTLEHSVEELLEFYRDYLSSGPDSEQIDFIETSALDTYSTHAPGSCPL